MKPDLPANKIEQEKTEQAKSRVAGAIAGFIIKEAAMLVVCQWLVPLAGVEIPWWVLLIIGVGIAVQSWLGYRWGKKSVQQKRLMDPVLLEGKLARVVEWVDEDVILVRVEGELWKAICKVPRPLVGDEVKVIKVLENLKLMVVGRDEPSPRGTSSSPPDRGHLLTR